MLPRDVLQIFLPSPKREIVVNWLIKNTYLLVKTSSKLKIKFYYTQVMMIALKVDINATLIIYTVHAHLSGGMNNGFMVYHDDDVGDVPLFVVEKSQNLRVYLTKEDHYTLHFGLLPCIP